MMMAGATWVSAGSAVYYRGPRAFGEIAKEMKAWMEANGVKSLKDITGVAHEKTRGC
jgi:dihydroorotate dehydrogenase